MLPLGIAVGRKRSRLSENIEIFYFILKLLSVELWALDGLQWGVTSLLSPSEWSGRFHYLKCAFALSSRSTARIAFLENNDVCLKRDTSKAAPWK